MKVQRGTDNWLRPMPATFVLATDAIITARYVGPDYRGRMAIEDRIAAPRAAA